MTERVVTTFAMVEGLYEQIFSAEARARLDGVAAVEPGPVLQELTSEDARARLRNVEVLITGWSCPPIDAEVLASAPHLRAIVHACGTVKFHVTPACWERGIVVSSGAAANAKPVAEYTLAMILLAGKDVFALQRRYRAEQRHLDLQREALTVGNYGRRVGIIGASLIGRRVIELLAPHDVTVLVADPYLDAATARTLGAELVELDELLASCDIVSLHAPELPSTYHMLDRRRLALIPDGATFINTARGSIVDQAALTDEVASGRIDAILDVSDPEPPPADSPLWTLPNVILTPHVAGAMGVELLRQGDVAIAELERYVAGEPFAHPVHAVDLERLA